MAWGIELIWVNRERKCFFKWDWTAQITLIRLDKFVPARSDGVAKIGGLRLAKSGRRLCEEQNYEAIHLEFRDAGLWIAWRSLSSDAHSRDPLARNDQPTAYGSECPVRA
jgi:hypothetical protein